VNASKLYIASLTVETDEATQVTSQTANSQSTTTAASGAFGLRTFTFLTAKMDADRSAAGTSSSSTSDSTDSGKGGAENDGHENAGHVSGV